MSSPISPVAVMFLIPDSRAAWRLEQAERELTWALVSARPEGISIRTLATAIGLSPSRDG